MRKQSYHRITRPALASLLALTMLASMTACGSKTSENAQSAEAAETTAQAAAAEETTKAESAAAETSGAEESSSAETTQAAETTAAAADTKDQSADPANALRELKATVAGINAQNGHVALTTVHQSLYNYDEESRSTATCDYDLTYTLTEDDKNFPQLAAALDDYSQSLNDTFTEEYENLKETAAQAARDRGSDLTDTLSCSTSMSSCAVRTDSNVVSLYNSYYSYQGGAHGYYFYSGSNFDTATGALLTSADVVKDGDALIKYLKEELVKQYPDVSFAFMEDYFADAHALDNTSFLCRYDGVEFFFAPYSLASYAEGTQSIVVPAGRTDLLNEKYLDFPKTYITVIDAERPFCFDANGDGSLESVTVERNWLDDGSGQMSYTVDLEGERLLEEAYAYSITPYIVRTGTGTYLYVEEQSDNDYRLTTVFDLTGTAPVKVADGDDTFFGAHATASASDGESGTYVNTTYEWSDPSAILMDRHMDVLKTTLCAAVYSVSENGTPETTQENYAILSTLYVTAKKDLSLMEVDSFLADIGETAVKSGTRLLMCLSNGEDTVYLYDEAAEKIYRVTLDKSGWPYTINGEPEEDCFDGIAYAG